MIEYQKEYVSTAQSYDSNGRYCYLTGGACGEKEIFDKSWFDKCIDVEFEGNYYYAPVGYSEMLSKLYGNYMELPPVEKRITHHDFVVYLK